jgi:hypothetical protein
MKLRILVSSMLAAGLLGAGSAAIAQPSKAPVRLTDAQMDQIVAGGTFTDTYTDTSTTVQWFHGYSNNPAPEGAPGTSSVETTTTTTYERTMDCPGGNISSCYTGNGLNPNTQVLSTTVLSSSSTSVLLTGPGKSLK